MTVWTTTTAAIYSARPSSAMWLKLRQYLGMTTTQARNNTNPVSFATILTSNGLDDALWCLQTLQGRESEIRLFAVWCARQVSHWMTDPRSFDALHTAEQVALGKGSLNELFDTWNAAGRAVTDAASDAAWDAAHPIAWNAAGGASRAALRALAREDTETLIEETYNTTGDLAEEIDPNFSQPFEWETTRTSAWSRWRAPQEVEFLRMVSG